MKIYTNENDVRDVNKIKLIHELDNNKYNKNELINLVYGS